MKTHVAIDGVPHRLELSPEAITGGDFTCAIDGASIEANAQMIEPGILSLILHGRHYRCTLEGDAVIIAGTRYPFAIEDPRSLRGRNGTGAGAHGPRSVKAPMPGRVVRLLVAKGDEVAEHQGVVVIEAMKMQNELKSPKAGRVTQVAVTVDSTVGSGETLVVIE